MKTVNTRNHERGFMLVTMYLVISIVVIFSIAFFARHAVFTRATELDRNQIIAFNMAESGIDFALAQLASNPNYAGTNGYIDMTANSPEGGFSITVTTPANDSSMRMVQATGFYPDNNVNSQGFQNSALTVYCQTAPGGIDFGIFTGTGDIVLSGGSLVDSYNSEDGAYSPVNKGQNGDLGSNGTSADTISISNNSLVEGNIVIGVGGDPATAINAPEGTVTGSQSAATAPVSYDPIATTIASSGPLNLNSSQTLLPGTYRYDSLKIVGNGELIVTGETQIYVDGDVDIGGNGVVNQTTSPPNLIIFVTNSSPVKISGGGTLYGTLYAPASHITNTGSGDIYGGIVADSYNNKGGSAIHYDEALAKLQLPGSGSGPQNVTVMTWQEQNTLAWGTGSTPVGALSAN